MASNILFIASSSALHLPAGRLRSSHPSRPISCTNCSAFHLKVAAKLPYLNRSAGKIGVNRILLGSTKLGVALFSNVLPPWEISRQSKGTRILLKEQQSRRRKLFHKVRTVTDTRILQSVFLYIYIQIKSRLLVLILSGAAGLINLNKKAKMK